MNNIVLAIVSYAVNAAWQVPLLAAAGWAACRLLRRWGPQPEHVAWVATLTLSLATPALVTRPAILRSAVIIRQSISSGSTIASIGARGGESVWRGATLMLPPWLIWSLFVAYVASLLYFAARLVWLHGAARALLRSACPETFTAGTNALWQRARWAFAPADAAVLASERVHGVMTIGARRPAILLPVGFAAESADHDLLSALGHELAHVQRCDYGKNLLYEIASIAVAFHPAIWFIKMRVVETREMVCDAMVAGRLVDSRTYRDSLLRMAQRMVTTQTTAIYSVGMFDANILEKRIMMIKTKQKDLGGFSRAGLAGCTAILLTATMIAVTAFARPVDRTAAQDDSSGKVYKIGGDVTAPVLKNSIEAKFPKSANLPKGQSAICLIGLVVDRDGMPQEIHVARSAGKDFDASAVKAVEQYRFSPAMRAGNPVAVKITIEVNFKKY